MKLKFLVFSLLLSVFTFAQKSDVIKETKDSVIVEIERLGTEINSSFHDYAPVITANGEYMYFTSRRPYSVKEIKRNRESMEKIYEAIFDDVDSIWLDPVALPDPINIMGRHNSNIAISNDGQRLLKYQDDGNGNGDIYESILEGKKWSKPVSLGGVINSEYHESSASIAPDGRTIYFVSDRPGGEGGRDIWFATKTYDGNWSSAKNLGNLINTDQDEEAVFIHPDGTTLYFSSTGHNSMGGYDVFKSKLVNGEWTKPINLGTPINTEEDDMFFVLTADGRTGYYASGRGDAVKNIFEIRFTPIGDESGPKLTVFSGTVKDGKTLIPLGANIEVIDNEKDEVIGNFTANSETGKYLISLPSGKNYGINFSKEGYLFVSHSFDLTNDSLSSYKEVKKDVLMNKLDVGSKVILKNVFFDTDKSTLRKESKNELSRLIKILETNPTLKIEIGGHTDSRGAAEYNLRLSKDRAQSVVNYLIDYGISKDRLTFKGYGKNEPIATNDTEEGRQENRRVEIKVISK